MNYTFLIATVGAIAVILAIAAFSKFELADENYDRLAYLVQRWSYIVVFVGLVAKTFNMPYGIETTTLVAGIGALMAGLMNISTENWKLSQPQITFNSDSFLEMMDGDFGEVEDEDSHGMSEEEE